jgi:hypothetical protein
MGKPASEAAPQTAPLEEDVTEGAEAADNKAAEAVDEESARNPVNGGGTDSAPPAGRDLLSGKDAPGFCCYAPLVYIHLECLQYRGSMQYHVAQICRVLQQHLKYYRPEDSHLKSPDFPSVADVPEDLRFICNMITPTLWSNGYFIAGDAWSSAARQGRGLVQAVGTMLAALFPVLL